MCSILQTPLLQFLYFLVEENWILAFLALVRGEAHTCNDCSGRLAGS